MAESAQVVCRVNGDTVTLEGHPMERLLDAIRLRLGLTGTKEGCGEGECGACSILLNGELVNSCLVPLLHADGGEIVTIEGLSGGVAACLQESFVERGGAQCGICTPGMLMAAADLLRREPHPSEDRIRGALAGNLCRCTGYMRIVEAVKAASARGDGKAT